MVTLNVARIILYKYINHIKGQEMQSLENWH